jgi:hypothetical protein
MLALGFAQIDLSKVGPTRDFTYAVDGDPLDRLFVRAKGPHVDHTAPFAVVALPRTTTAPLKVTGRTARGYTADLVGARLRFASDTPGVAGVDRNGIIRAKKKGTAEISVEATLDGVTKTTTIVVVVGPRSQ